MRECYACGSIKTYVYNGYRSWYHNKPFEQWLCSKCNHRYVANPIINRTNNPKRIAFKDKRILLDTIPRTGYCSWCSNNIHDGSCKTTNIHHISYDDSDPLANTVEICASCHAKESGFTGFWWKTEK